MDVAAIFTTLFGSLTTVVGVFYLLLRTRIRNLEKENSELVQIILTTCQDKAESVAALAALVGKRGEA